MLPTLVHSRSGFISPVHVFEFRGDHFALFVQMGRMTRLEAAAATALKDVETGAYHADPTATAQRLLEQFGAETRDRVLNDLAVLECTGFLRGDLAALSDEQRATDVDELLGHHPRNLMFFVTEACNLACTYCYEKNQGVHDAPAMMQREDARRIIDKYIDGSSRKSLTITFFGGEPLLNPQLIQEAVAYAKERAAAQRKEIGFTMTSNLTLLTPAMADFLAREKFHVMVSLDGDREANDRYRVQRDGSGTYDKVVANLRVLIDATKRHKTRLPKIRATMTTENADSIAIERHLRSLGTHLVEVGETHGTVSGRRDFDVSHDQAHTAKDAVASHIEEVLEALARGGPVPRLLRSIREGLQRTHEELSTKVEHGPARPKLCGVWRNMKAVTPKGDLFPCHRYVGMNAFRFGNIHETGADQTRVRDYYNQVYDAFAAKCAPCWLRYACGGQCPWYLSKADGSISPPDDATCDVMRRSHERMLGFYAALACHYPAALASYLDIPTPGDGNPGTTLPQNAPDDSCGL